MTDDLIRRCFGRLPVTDFDRVEEKMMYESPITRFAEDIMTDIVKREEGYLVESVHKVGFDINKEELEKALRYDRNQYEKGFADGRLSASPRWIPVTERLPEPYTEVLAFVNDGSKYCEVLNYDTPGDGTYTLQFYRTDYDGYPTIYTENVTAWMPLPEPWKGEADGNN